MGEFFKFPSTPHLIWLGDTPPREDKVLPPAEREAFLDGPIVVEEKVDGANLGLSFDAGGNLVAQNRGTVIHREAGGQFKSLPGWLAPRLDSLLDALGTNLILFGEWCVAIHSIAYDRLPDWFLVFDIFDRDTGEFWPTSRRGRLSDELGLRSVPALGKGRFTREDLMALMATPSRFRSGPLEGIYLRSEDENRLLGRAKIVRPEFVQAIGEHWSRGALRRNAIQWK